jgi:hypothetical protein
VLIWLFLLLEYKISFHYHKAFYQRTEAGEHVSNKSKNGWFIALPISVLLCGSFVISSTVLDVPAS